jgi:RIO-like serine/threonine protein kinase
MPSRGFLKSDLFGSVGREAGYVKRDLTTGPAWARPLARWLAGREARALVRAAALGGVPSLVSFDGDHLRRKWIAGTPMQVARPADPAYFRAALTLLRRLHRAGIAHNDLAQEPNWLVQPDGRPALIGFQLAKLSRRRGLWFRRLAREDLRHLLAHKRSYCPGRLTARQRRMLADPGLLSRVWRQTGRLVYQVVTRRMLGWRNREGAGEHG